MGYYLLFIGALIIALALWVVIKHLKLLLLGETARGVIVDVEEKLRYGDSNRRKIYFHPVIEFKTITGQSVRFTFGGGSTHRRPVVGDAVTVIYDTNRPDAATLNSFMGLWAGPIAATILGGGTLFGGIQMVFFDVQ